LGFAIAARSQAKDILPWLRKLDAQKEKTVNRALALTAQAFPGIGRPDAGESAGVRATRCCLWRQAGCLE
jgi:hypothetical protein